MNLSLTEAFGRFGAKPSNRPGSHSAIAVDGALVLECSRGIFRHPSTGVLRYEGRLSSDSGSRDTESLAEHLTLARDGALPIRMVVAREINSRNGTPIHRFDVRPDLLGKVVKFDGDHFIVDFTRMRSAPAEPNDKRK
jgi:hypothetical protein